MIECLEYKPIDKGIFKGFATLKVEKWGLIIKSCSLFEKNGHRWIAFPAQMVDSGAEKKYFPYLKFEERSVMDAFSKEAVRAIDIYEGRV